MFFRNLIDAPEVPTKVGMKRIRVNKDFWLSYQGHTMDALALEGDEGRGNLR